MDKPQPKDSSQAILDTQVEEEGDQAEEEGDQAEEEGDQAEEEADQAEEEADRGEEEEADQAETPPKATQSWEPPRTADTTTDSWARHPRSLTGTRQTPTDLLTRSNSTAA